MEPAPRIELGPPPYRGGVLPLSPSRHGAGGPGFGPGLSRPKRDGLPLPQPPSEPPSGADPDLPPYKGKAAAVCDGMAPRRGFEPRLTGPEPVVLPLDDPGSGTGGGSRTRTSEAHQDLSLARLPLRHARVRRQGVEPRSAGLRVRCFTVTARGALRGPRGNRTLLAS